MSVIIDFRPTNYSIEEHPLKKSLAIEKTSAIMSYMPAMIEKDIESKIENVEIYNKYAKIGISDEDATFYSSFSEDKRKAMLWKVDIRLVPCLALLYLAAHIDRANIGNAKIEGMLEDLNMSAVQYNIVLSVFFIPYILLEVQSNIVLKKFARP